MAQVIAAGLGLTVPPGPVETELVRVQADPLFALVRDRRELRSEAWLPFVGYTGKAAFKSDSVTAAEQAAKRLEAEIETLAAK